LALGTLIYTPITLIEGNKSHAYIALFPGAEHNYNKLFPAYIDKARIAIIEETSIPYKLPE
jgi:hypothetical protein